MTSVLNVDTIADKAGTGPVTLTNQSAAKMFANLNGSGAIALRKSSNVSGTTDNGTGDYTFSFTNSFSDNDYAPVVGMTAKGSFAANSMAQYYESGGDGALATGSIRCGNNTRQQSADAADADFYPIAIFGDLA